MVVWRTLGFWNVEIQAGLWMGVEMSKPVKSAVLGIWPVVVPESNKDKDSDVAAVGKDVRIFKSVSRSSKCSITRILSIRYRAQKGNLCGRGILPVV